ncbi:glycosyltransferase family 61 protein [Crocosphaera sp. XPORK-15E]|uniref:glycosyltransferase family 61 protein n=1 Tax=Crocosphaera sp. XPORK-15E TaxID=3110247 RepID=UPI002B209AD1|nr:glycosyltransferase family 61 protein [Crocosphaera sp. XPORK-15E]MEA5534720.1 glycosyltransferase family 61 protein [Crocosphaera sp. XPORK-15E]
MAQFNPLNNWKIQGQKWLRNHLIDIVHINDCTTQIQQFPLNLGGIPTPEIRQMSSVHLPDPVLIDAYSLPPIYTATLNNILYYSTYNCLFTSSRKLILESAGYLGYELKLEKFSLRTLYLKPVEKLSGTYSIYRAINRPTNYYHSLIDYLPRVYLLDQPDYQNQPIKLLLSSPPTNIENFFLQKLLPKNIELCMVDSQKIYELETVVFPSIMTRPRAGYLPQPYLEYLLKKIAPKRPRNKINRIFISREKAKNRRIINEDKLLEIIAKYGFKKYCLETLSVEEQIELFYDADSVIAPHGAGLANLIFSRQVNVLELFAEPKVLPHYYYLCQALDHRYDYCFAEYNSPQKLNGFSVNLQGIYNYLETLN